MDDAGLDGDLDLDAADEEDEMAGELDLGDDEEEDLGFDSDDDMDGPTAVAGDVDDSGVDMTGLEDELGLDEGDMVDVNQVQDIEEPDDDALESELSGIGGGDEMVELDGAADMDFGMDDDEEEDLEIPETNGDSMVLDESMQVDEDEIGTVDDLVGAQIDEDEPEEDLGADLGMDEEEDLAADLAMDEEEDPGADLVMDEEEDMGFEAPDDLAMDETEDLAMDETEDFGEPEEDHSTLMMAEDEEDDFGYEEVEETEDAAALMMDEDEVHDGLADGDLPSFMDEDPSEVLEIESGDIDDSDMDISSSLFEDDDDMSGGIEVIDDPRPPAQAGGESLVQNERLLQLTHELTVEVGKATIKGEDITSLTYGSVIELDKKLGDPVNIVLGDELVAQGEVVQINEDQLGVRITRINL